MARLRTRLIITTTLLAVAAACGGSDGSDGSDGSAIDAGAPTDAAPDDAAEVLPDSACTETFELAPQIPLTIIVILDRSGSMGVKWDQSVQGLTTFLSAPDSVGIEVALSFLPVGDGGDSCNPTDYNPPHAPLTVLPESTDLVSALQSQSATGPTTPTYGALFGTYQYATSYQDANPDRRVKVILATDGQANSCPDNQNDIGEIAGLAAVAFNYNGVQTYVIAIQGSSVADLNQIAAAGQTVQATDITSDTTRFAQAMVDIRRLAAACEHPPPAAVTDLSTVNLYLTPVGATDREFLGRTESLGACGDSPGWYIDSNNSPATAVLCPASCAVVTAAPGATVEFGVGCGPAFQYTEPGASQESRSPYPG